jgi:hypothetical protein
MPRLETAKSKGSAICCTFCAGASRTEIAVGSARDCSAEALRHLPVLKCRVGVSQVWCDSPGMTSPWYGQQRYPPLRKTQGRGRQSFGTGKGKDKRPGYTAVKSAAARLPSLCSGSAGRTNASVPTQTRAVAPSQTRRGVSRGRRFGWTPLTESPRLPARLLR